MMKNLLLALLAVFALTACDDKGDGGSKPIDLTGGTSSDLTFDAGAVAKSEGIQIMAKEPWTITVVDVTTKADLNQIDWLKVSQYSGGAGDFILTLSLTKNTSGTPRKAEIHIVCGGSTIIITIEQKATTDPEEPENPDPDKKSIVDKISFTKEDTSGGSYEFVYDNQQRVISCEKKTYRANGTYLKTLDFKFTYSSASKILITVGTYEYVSTPNSDGYLTSISSRSNYESGYEYGKKEIEYENGYMIKESGGYGSDNYSYTWLNNNLQSAKNRSETFNYSYSNHPNNLPGIDLNALQSQSSKIEEDFDLTILSMIGLCGKRSANYTTTHIYDKWAYRYDPNSEYTRYGEFTDSPIEYTFNNDNYPTEIFCKFNCKEYKEKISTGERELESETDYTTHYTISYK